MEAKVIAQLKRALEPSLRKVEIDWDGLKIQQAPWLIRPLFNGERTIVYGLLEQKLTDLKKEYQVKLRGIGPEVL